LRLNFQAANDSLVTGVRPSEERAALSSSIYSSRVFFSSYIELASSALFFARSFFETIT